MSNHDKTKCEYCAAELPLGVDVKTRRIRSAHFTSCPKKPKREPPEMNSLDKMMALVIAHEGRIEAINLQLAEQQEERTRLRAVYWASRAVLACNGIDKLCTITAVTELRDAIDSVMSLDSGREGN